MSVPVAASPDRAQLEAALEHYRDLERGGAFSGHTRALVAAAVAHLATLPPPAEPEDHVIICRDKGTGGLTFWRGLGKEVMTASEAADRIKRWSADYSHMTYVAVEIPS